jgi:ribosome-binding factor A
MGQRIEKVNKHIQRTFGEILLKEADVPPGVFVTISRVDTTPNLRSATVWLYISPPQKSEETLDMLTKQLYDLQGSLNRALSLKPLPRIYLCIDQEPPHGQSF